jgi:uncharacterized protein YdeI (YjbR/CyaY-like superfamily)
MAEELPELIVSDAQAWQGWLRDHHDQTSGVWLVLAKKGTTTPTVLTYDQALEEGVAAIRRDATRSRRIEQFVAMLARGETVYLQKRTLDS